ncbi:MAG: uncharacterized protein PWQ96_486 [Clostridia bacterium]|nr:protein of unknown function YeeE/YedE [Clostridiales bacterium]MDK2984844.1 uncharacterized protein [Clostridia bacterium]
MSEAIMAAKKEAKRRKKKNQAPWGLVVLIFAIIVALLFLPQKNLAFSWVIGLSFGFVLQRASLCFLSGFSELIITGNTSLVRAIIIAIFIGSIGFAFLQYTTLTQTSVLIGYVGPVGVHTVVGALLFGLGMVIAGACSSGTIMRIGEGFLLQIVVLIGFMIGAFWGARDYGWWHDKFIAGAPAIHLPQVMGWPLAIFIQLAVLIFIYFALLKYEEKRF